MPLTIESATALLETGAYDVRFVSPYVVNYRIPNSYAKGGYIGNLRFLAVPLARDILAGMPELAGWIVAGYGNDPLCESAEYARLVNGAAHISIHATRTWGANAYKRISVEAYATDADHRSHKVDSFTVAGDRAPDAIVKGIREILPALAAKLASVGAADKARANAAAETAAKCESLARRYPELRFHVDKGEPETIHASTKHGARVAFRGYMRRPQNSGETWNLLWSRHGDIGLTDIDSGPARDFLKLANGS